MSEARTTAQHSLAQEPEAQALRLGASRYPQPEAARGCYWEASSSQGKEEMT
jgi:hypothetical protein